LFGGNVPLAYSAGSPIFPVRTCMPPPLRLRGVPPVLGRLLARRRNMPALFPWPLLDSLKTERRL